MNPLKNIALGLLVIVFALASFAAEKGLLVVPVHQFPFQAGFQRLRERLGSLGTLRSVEFVTFTAGGTGLRGLR